MIGASVMIDAPSTNSIKEEFLGQTGYVQADILSWNLDTGRFLTINGGDYRLTADGQIEHLGGPSPKLEERDDL